MEFVHRGVVEGFYGPPFRHADRLWLIERIGRWGMNRYVYAPKNDPLHRDRWREPYPDAQLREFEALVAHGEKHGVGVTFALSPGLSIRYSSDEDVSRLAEKFRAFVALGARSLALLLDDVPSHLVHDEDRRAFRSLGDAHTVLANRVQQSVGPGIAWWLCPTDYLGTRASEYLETLGTGLDPATEVGWTGRTVCSPEIRHSEAARRAEALRRRVLVWDNVPVTDGPMRFMLHLGPYGRRDPDLAHAVSGVLLNPMQHPHASAVALHTAAAYLADPQGYDPERAWAAALEDIGEGAPRAFALFAQAHRFSPLWPEHRDRALELAQDGLRASLERGDAATTIAELRTLLAERLSVAETLRRDLVDRVLLEEIEPWIEAHRIETQRMAWALDAIAGLVGDGAPSAKLTALFALELRLGSEAQPRHVSYGPRRVLYPQLSSMFEDAMGLGTDPALLRGRCLADEFVALAEDLALKRLGTTGGDR